MKRFIVFSLAICALIVGMTSVTFAGTQSLQKEHGLLAESENILELPDSDELLTEFIEKHASAKAMGEQAVRNKKTRGARLTGNEAMVYEAARKGAEKIAAGESDSAKIEVSISDMLGGKLEYTAEDLGLDTLLDDNNQLSDEACNALYKRFDFDEGKVLAALIYDTPYDFYWFNKTKGYSISVNFRQYVAKYKDKEYVIGFDRTDPAWELGFIVSRDYSKNGNVETVDVDTNKTKAAATAAATAGSIVKKTADKTDLQKLTAYKDKVCELADYNVAAATDERIEYGNPWQLIYVFDGDEATKVVCEGYTKAFQFLCDLTEFKSAVIKSHMVTGMMVGGTGEGGHMWNIVHMDDGKNYLVDVTNSDEDTIGDPDLLFLKGYTTGSLSNGYTYKCNDENVYYQYDSQTKNQYDNDELTLSGEDYKEAPCDHEMKKTDEKQATCTSDGNTAYWTCGKCGRYFSDADGKNEINEGDWVVKGGHDIKHVTMKKATATAEGNFEYWYCTRCSTHYSDAEGKTVIDKEDTVIPANDFKVVVKKKQYSAKYRKKTTIKGTDLYNVMNKKGKVTYKKASGKSKFTVSSKNGNIVVKKGLKKGIYVVKVKVTTAATEQYTACSKTVSVKIKVK